MVESPHFRMADRLAGGRLTDIIVERRVRGKESLDRIARDLYADFGIEVTRQTLAKWEHAVAAAQEPAA